MKPKEVSRTIEIHYAIDNDISMVIKSCTSEDQADIIEFSDDSGGQYIIEMNSIDSIVDAIEDFKNNYKKFTND